MKAFSVALFFFICSIYGNENKELPYPYNQIEIRAPYYHGWFCNQKQLDRILSRNNILIVVELGSWLGESTSFIARKLPINGKVYAVDHWKGSIEHQDPRRTDVYFLLPTLYEQFLSNIIHLGLTDKIIPVKMTTVEAALALKINPDLVYVDASHDELSVYEDIKNWYAKLARNGILCGDDWCWETVQRAVKRFAFEHNIKIRAEDNFWEFSPKKN